MAFRATKAEKEGTEEGFNQFCSQVTHCFHSRPLARPSLMAPIKEQGRMYVTIDMWKVSTGSTSAIIPNFSGFREEEFILNAKAGLHPLSYPPLGGESNVTTGYIWEKELSLLGQSLPFFDSLGAYLTDDSMCSTLPLHAAGFAEEGPPRSHRSGRPCDGPAVLENG